jgi:hypothetical protein
LSHLTRSYQFVGTSFLVFAGVLWPCAVVQSVWYILIYYIQISGIYWWYKTASHAAELAAGYYNPCNRDGYAAITAMLKRNGVNLNIACVDLHTFNQHESFPEPFADPERLVWQVSI